MKRHLWILGLFAAAFLVMVIFSVNARTDADPTPAGLFKQGYRGSRYSFGYPACPDMAGHDVIWRLIDPTRIGCELTENHQIVPEQSTSAIVVHHPEARYFNA